jgi:hypothetical protein
MYLVIWVAFLQVLFIFFAPSTWVSVAIHALIGVGIVGLTFQVNRGVMRTDCPARIKRISRTTFMLALFQGFLGIIVALGHVFSWPSIAFNFLLFLHLGNALAIITQASSTATSYDMWEEKEFMPTSPHAPASLTTTGTPK